MARRIEIKGPLRYLLSGLLLVVFAGSWLVPDVPADLTGTATAAVACCAAAKSSNATVT